MTCPSTLTAPPEARRRPCRRRGFTVVELLTAGGVVGILAALAVPSLLRGIQVAQSSRCLGNLRQLAAANAAYEADHDGQLVPTSTGSYGNPNGSQTWRSLILPYAGNAASSMAVFACPSDSISLRQLKGIGYWSAATGLNPCSYGIPGNGHGAAPGLHAFLGYQPGIKSSGVTRSAGTILFCDIGLPDALSAPFPRWAERGRSINNASWGNAVFPAGWGSGDWTPYPRHAGRFNAIFYDGHAAPIDLQGQIVAHPPGDPLCLYQ